jgi:hypothetical protein
MKREKIPSNKFVLTFVSILFDIRLDYYLFDSICRHCLQTNACLCNGWEDRDAPESHRRQVRYTSWYTHVYTSQILAITHPLELLDEQNHFWDVWDLFEVQGAWNWNEQISWTRKGLLLNARAAIIYYYSTTVCLRAWDKSICKITSKIRKHLEGAKDYW